MLSIFTTSQAATTNFDRNSNGYPKHEKIRSKVVIENVFRQDDNDVEHFQKLVHMQNQQDPFKYTIADMYDDFRMGSDAQWAFNDKIKFKRDCIDKNNTLFDRYNPR